MDGNSAANMLNVALELWYYAERAFWHEKYKHIITAGEKIKIAHRLPFTQPI